MKKLLLLLSLITPLSGFGASGTGKVDASYIESVRQGSAPGSPAAGKVRWYTLDSDGKLYVKNSGGTAKACTYSGDIVDADISSSAAIANSKMANMSQSTFKCRTTAGTGAPEDCTAAQSQAIVGTVPQLLAHQSTPSNPSAGSVKVYAKSDNNVYILDSGGTETKLATSAGAGAAYSFIGIANFPPTASCLWTRNNPTFTDFNSDADCPGPTVTAVDTTHGTIQTTDADLPQVTVNDMPAGTYRVSAYFSGFNSGGGRYGFRLSDGTTHGPDIVGSGSEHSAFYTSWIFTYASSGNNTFKIQGRNNANTVNIAVDGGGVDAALTFIFERIF